MVSLVERTPDSDKHVSQLAFVETRSAIRQRERASDITSADATAALALLADETRRVIQHPLNAATLARAESILDTHALRSLDALQSATALGVGNHFVSQQSVRFVCSDRRLLQAAVAEGLATWNPEET